MSLTRLNGHATPDTHPPHPSAAVPSIPFTPITISIQPPPTPIHPAPSNTPPPPSDLPSAICHLPFNPSPAAAAYILQSLTNPQAPLCGIADDHHTSVEALCRWIMSPEVQARLDIIRSVAALKVRMSVERELPHVGACLIHAMDQYHNELDIFRPDGDDTLKEREHRRRARATAGKHAWHLQHLATYTHTDTSAPHGPRIPKSHRRRVAPRAFDPCTPGTNAPDQPAAISPQPSRHSTPRAASITGPQSQSTPAAPASERGASLQAEPAAKSPDQNAPALPLSEPSNTPTPHPSPTPPNGHPSTSLPAPLTFPQSSFISPPPPAPPTPPKDTTPRPNTRSATPQNSIIPDTRAQPPPSPAHSAT
ncbi:hypothetical protein PHYC_00988 [Phycisphaerales bacterium]|nr:hypothetical protein PHYC_00988 [Phycisphaerales bacterium]